MSGTGPSGAGTSGGVAAGGPAPATIGVEDRIARLLLLGAVTGIAFVAMGVILMAAAGIDPLATTYPGFEAGRVIPDLLALRPEGFLWAGILVVIATPIARVLGELVTFALRRDRVMAAASGAIMVVVAASVVVARLVEG